MKKGWGIRIHFIQFSFNKLVYIDMCSQWFHNLVYMYFFYVEVKTLTPFLILLKAFTFQVCDSNTRKYFQGRYTYCSIKVCLPWTEKYVVRYHKLLFRIQCKVNENCLDHAEKVTFSAPKMSTNLIDRTLSIKEDWYSKFVWHNIKIAKYANAIRLHVSRFFIHTYFFM